MAELDKAGLKAQNDSLLPDNILQEIEPVDHRSVNSDVIDSNLNIAEIIQQTVDGPVDFLSTLTASGNGVMSPEKVIVINSVDDFPTPSLDVIELDPGYNVTYWIASKTIDIGVNRFEATGGNIVSFYGMHAQGSIITSDTTGSMFTITGSSLDMEKVALYCTDGTYFSGDGAGGFFIVLSRVIMVQAQNGGALSNFATYSFNRCVFLEYSVNGFSFSGTSSQFLFSNSTAGTQGGFLGYSGTMIDLGSAVFDTIVFNGGSRIFMGDGTTFLDGSASGANLSTRGSAELEGVLFINETGATTGVSVATITSKDNKWLFASNSFADGLDNTRSLGVGYLDTTGGFIETTNPGDNSFIPVNMNSLALTSADSSRYTIDSAGVVEYTGTPDSITDLCATLYVQRTSGTGPIFCNFKWTKSTDGGTIFNDINANAYSWAAIDIDNRMKAVQPCIGDKASTGDKYRLETQNVDSTTVDMDTARVHFNIKGTV